VTLRPGCRLVVAPAFHISLDSSQRILLGAGVEREGDGFVPRPPWRFPEANELGLLFPDPSLLERQELRNCLCLFQLPQHLRSAWWRMVEQAQETGAPQLDGFAAFVAEVANFLAFKDIAAPEGAAFDLLVSKPGQQTVPFGLTCNLGEARCSGLWGGINLGDEPTALLFINLLVGDIQAELARHPDYPPIRLRLEPGEGFRLPAGGLLVAGCTLDKEEPDVLLLVRHRGVG
jgi:hypothetical protein